MPEQRPELSAASPRTYPVGLTCNEILMCIDGVAGLVQHPDDEAAPLLRALQNLYKLAKELEPRV